MNFKLRLLALLLLVMMVFTSCSLESVLQYIPFLNSTKETETTTDEELPVKPATRFDASDFEKNNYSLTLSELVAKYTLTQEEVNATIALLDQMVVGAMPDPNGDPNVAVMTMEEWDALYEQFETSFYHVAEQMTIATIVYYYNTADEVASERYLNTQDMFYDIQDKYNESLIDLYRNSPMKDELFDGWSEQEIQDMLEYDPAIMEVKRVIDELEVEFDNLDDTEYSYTNKSVELYKKLIVERQKIAKYNGFSNYYEYASKNVYSRDYETDDLAIFRQYIIDYVVPSFKGVYSKFNAYKTLSDKRKETFIEFIQKAFDKTSKNYLIMYLNSLEGTMADNMCHMFENKNCIFSSNSNSHPTAFCTYLYETEQPFCLFGSNGKSANTIVHEMGHYYASVTNNDLDNYDLCETHSQGNEFLFIKFCEEKMNASVYSCVRGYNLVNACYVMILATIIDEFEQRVYALDDATIASMTSKDFDAIMDEVCEPYGGVDWVKENLADPYDYWRRVAISNPVYYISYAVSAVAAVEIFAIAESEGEGMGYEAAKTIYTTLAEGVEPEDGFLNALKKAGLYTPFEEDAFKLIKKTLNK